MKVEGSLQEMINFVAKSNGILDGGLADEDAYEINSQHLPSPSTGSSPLSLFSGGVNCRICALACCFVFVVNLPRHLLHLQMLDLTEMRMASEDGRRKKLYGIMACVRDIQKRNELIGVHIMLV